MNIKEVSDYLDKVELQYMATIRLDSKPKVRPVQYMVLHDKKLWFCMTKNSGFAQTAKKRCTRNCKKILL
ncbi:hypothetical protein [Treponema pectinovorum]|uniref:hypothetical protein n=1 Tax=Treponema pectinovorum TaxID=164 RepID=UPI003D8C3449